MENKEKNCNCTAKIIVAAAVAVVLVVAAFLVGRFLFPASENANTTDDTSVAAVAADAEASTEVTESVDVETASTIDPAVNAAVITGFDYGDQVTYVIGHKSPDTDTVMSAIAMANLLNELGIKAEARIAGNTNGETNFVVEKFGIALPEILADATDSQLWLVDHSEYAQIVTGGEEARIVGIVDHHGIGDVENSEMIYVNSANAGSAATLIWKLYKDCGVEIKEDIANVLLAAILSDTSYLSEEALTPLDESALEDLQAITGISELTDLCAEMKAAKIAYKGMTDLEIYHDDYKEYEANGFTYSIGMAKTATVEEVGSMADRMQAVLEEEIKTSGLDFAVAMVYNADHEYARVLIVSADEALADDLAANAFAGAEDFSSAEGNCAIFEPSVSRKAVIVPCIEEYLASKEK